MKITLFSVFFILLSEVSGQYFSIPESELEISESSGEVTKMNGVSIPNDFPKVQVDILKDTAPGKIFLCNPPYIMILENDGTPYFYKRLENYTQDYKVQPGGTLTRWNGGDWNFYSEMDSHYQDIDSLSCINGYKTDPHDIQLLSSGHYLLIAVKHRIMDMSLIVEGGDSMAVIRECNIHEYDEKHKLVFEWRSSDHFKITDAIHEVLTRHIIDYAHINAIAIDYDGHILISSRNLDEVTKINRQSGEIIWRLGGVNNQFQFINDEHGISYQHDIRPVPGIPNNYTIYDNGTFHTPRFSRAVEFHLDTLNMIATKVWEYRHIPDRYSSRMGNVQRLPNGNTLINWAIGSLPKATEVTPEGEIVYELSFTDPSDSYRTFRFEWEGVAAVPYLIGEIHTDKLILIFNKFGDTNVSEYRIYAGKNPKPDQLISRTSEPFIHFTDLVNNQTYFFRVTAVDSNGNESGFSNEEEIFTNFVEPGENLIFNGNFSQGFKHWDLGKYGNASATGNIDDGTYHIQIASGGVNHSDIQLIQNNLEIIRDRRYKLEFDAWSTGPKFFEIKIQKNIEPWIDYSRIGAAYSTMQNKHYTYEFTMQNPTDYSARIVFNCGESESDIFFDNISLSFSEVETNIESSVKSPSIFKLSANYPNPFNSSTKIEYALPEYCHVNIRVYNLLGELVQILVDMPQYSGGYDLSFDASGLSSGIYFYEMTAQSKVSRLEFYEVNKMLVLR